MKKLLALLALPAFLSACASSSPSFVGAVEKGGMSQVALGDMVWTGCGNDREFARRFSARGPQGQSMEGVVCGGLMGPTVFAAPVGSERLARVVPAGQSPTRLARIASIEAPR